MRILRVLIIVVIFLAGISAVILSLLYSHRNVELKTLTDNERRNTPGKYIHLSAGVTHYELAGPDSGKVVILVHGFSVPYYIWDGTYEYLQSKGFRVLRYDTYGRGYSDRPDTVYNQQLYDDQLTDLIKQLHLKTPLDIAGLSFGGPVSTVFACKHPDLVNKIVLIDPVYVDQTPHQPEFLKSYDEALHANDRLQSQVADFKHPEKHPKWVDLYRPQMIYKGFRHSLISTYYNYHYHAKDVLGCVKSAKKPVLLIWGKDDHTVTYNYSDSIRKALGPQEFFPVADAGHLPHLEKPEAVNNKIVEFLSK